MIGLGFALVEIVQVKSVDKVVESRHLLLHVLVVDVGAAGLAGLLAFLEDGLARFAVQQDAAASVAVVVGLAAGNGCRRSAGRGVGRLHLGVADPPRKTRLSAQPVGQAS